MLSSIGIIFSLNMSQNKTSSSCDEQDVDKPSSCLVNLIFSFLIANFCKRAQSSGRAVHNHQTIHHHKSNIFNTHNRTKRFQARTLLNHCLLMLNVLRCWPSPLSPSVIVVCSTNGHHLAYQIFKNQINCYNY